MSQDEVLKLISDRVESMNDRGLINAEKQGKIMEKVEGIQEDIKEIKRLSHTSLNCPNTPLILQAIRDSDDAKKDAKSSLNKVMGFQRTQGMSKKQQVGIIGAISTGVVAAIETVLRVFKP